METRSRKRAEASTPPNTHSQSQPCSSSSSSRKRARLCYFTSAVTTASPRPPPPIRPPPHRLTRAISRPQEGMDSGAVESSSASASRRDSAGKQRSYADGKRDKDSADKGKEKESERGRERGAVLSIDGGGGAPASMSASASAAEEENESEGGVSILHQNLTSASSALQGLLRKLGAGLDDLLPSSMAMPSSHGSSRLKRILSGLRAEGEEGRQVEALTQLCELLSIGTEESLGSFSVDSFVPVLVSLVNHESNADIMLLAARALTHLCDVLPSSCAAVVHYGAVPCFCARLLTIEYMDLAEQSLQALEKISHEHPTACLRAGALMAVLSYLDFFSTGVQRVALSTAANMCKKLPSDAADFVMEAVPLLTNLLHYHDSKVLELASVCLTRIAESFASSPDKLDELCNHGLVAQSTRLVSVSSSGGAQASLSTPTYTGLIRLLSTCASGSTLATKTLLLLGISGILRDILAGTGALSSISVSSTLNRPPEQMYEIVSLVNELLPPLLQGTISLPVSYSIKSKVSLGKQSLGSNTVKQEDVNGNMPEISAREKLFCDQPELLAQFGIDLFPVLVQVYGSSVNAPVRHKCLSAISKLMYFSTSDMLQSLLRVTNISSFLAGVLAWKDPQVLIPALQIAEVLMQKLPDVFYKMFVREGVVHAVDTLILSNQSSTNSMHTGKDQDGSIGVMAKRRRNRPRGGGLNSDTNGIEEPKGATTGVAGSPPSSGDALIPTLNSGLRAAVSAHAKRFKDTYFPADSSSVDAGVTERLCNLKNLCLKLNGNLLDSKTKSKGKGKAVGHGSAANDEQFLTVVAEILEELSRGDGVSTFEFIGSGVVESLLNYFSCSTFSKDNVMEADLIKLQQQALKRFKLFIELALPYKKPERGVPMKFLVNKLQDALASLERFPVILSHAPRSSTGNASISAGLSALSQPFKLRLCRAQGEKSLRDYSSNVILIDPLANLAAVEEFLWPRIQRSEPIQKSTSTIGGSDSGAGTPSTGASCPLTSTPAASDRRPSTRSRSLVGVGNASGKELDHGHASSSKGKGKAVLKCVPSESKGPQTRNATRRKAASERESQMKQSQGNSGSEDEDLVVSPIEIDEALVIEDDISDDDDEEHEVFGEEPDPVCVPERVHDVKLGDTGEDDTHASSTGKTQSQGASGSGSRSAILTRSESADLKTGSSLGTKASLSFAAAAMAGLASSDGRGGRGIRDHHSLSMGNSTNDPPRLSFFSCGKQLNRSLTIYQAIQRQAVADEDDDERYTGSDYAHGEGRKLWDDIYTITYKRADLQGERGFSGVSTGCSTRKAARNATTSASCSETSWQQASLLDSILQGELPCDLEKSNATYNILLLLRVMEGLNRLAHRLRAETASDAFIEGKISTFDELRVVGPAVPQEEFLSSKLTSKLARQIQDALALCSGSLPSWCHQLTKACPFLFPFETRRQYFHSTAFGLSRALQRLQQQHTADNPSLTNEREIRVGRLQRQKVRVSRSRILDSAAKVMEMYSGQKAVLEVEYFGEVGTGLGPTLEFYTLLSHELQKSALGMWRSSVEFTTNTDIERPGETTDCAVQNGEYVQASLGLFPRPWLPNADAIGSQFSKVLDYFRLLGRVMAKALQDGRLLDLPLSTAFYKLVLGQELDLYDILSFDTELGTTLQEMQVLVHRKQFLECMPGDYGKELSELCFRGVKIEDLCLDFTLPGYPEYALKSGENDTMVNMDNLEEYISLVVDAVVKTGIIPQMEAFRAGFNQVFPISSLQIFAANELDYLLCGRRELWVAETLVDHIKFDHGYTAKSPPIINLLQIMGEFTPEQQRAFCQFVTGAPRLPPGGLAVLNPKLTIVRKHSTANGGVNGTAAAEAADGDLPSVMTCANYLKLPPYSSKEVMRDRLLYAISEGQGSFDLS
uniref:HECT-type E3 ubiquitin transferase n=1 Tax=Araucaria cunninghamii TaxID=56994 RepID=A0A0D6QT53_ARACU